MKITKSEKKKKEKKRILLLFKNSQNFQITTKNVYLKLNHMAVEQKEF